MPVTRSDGARTRPLGLNVKVVARALREHGLTTAASGAAHLRWSENTGELPGMPTERTVLLLTVARQSLRSADANWRGFLSRMYARRIGSLEP